MASAKEKKNVKFIFRRILHVPPPPTRVCGPELAINDPAIARQISVVEAVAHRGCGSIEQATH
jgi:hypothetical protein